MILKCAVCGQNIEFADDLPDGQHIRCPYCSMKMELSHSLDGIPSFRVLSGDVEPKQTPSRLHVRRPDCVNVPPFTPVPPRTSVPAPQVSSPQTERKRGGSGDWVLYVLLVAIVCGGIVVWVHKRGKGSDISPSVAQIGLSEDSNSRSDINADIESRHKEEDAERDRRKIREEEEREKRRVEKMKRDAEREKERQEMAERVERERQLREIVSKVEMSFNGVDSVFAMDFPTGKRPFDFTEDGVIIVADESYIENGSLYRLVVEDKHLQSVQKISRRNDAESIAPTEFMLMATNKIVLAKTQFGPAWICGKTKQNEMIEVPESTDSYAPLADFMGGALRVLNALRGVAPAVKYRVTLKSKRGKGEVKVGIVEKEIDLQSVRSKIRERLTDRKLKSAGSGIKPPTMKKFKRTVVFYEGDKIFKTMNGVTKVPRSFKFFGTSRNHDDKAHVSDIIENARRKWEELRMEAERQDKEELAVEAENQRRMDEYRRKTDAAVRDSKVTEAEVDAELGLYRLFIERSRTKLAKE